MEQAGSTIVAKASPGLEHVLLGSISQRFHIGKPLEPLLVPRLSFSCTSVVADSGYKRAFAPMCKRNAS